MTQPPYQPPIDQPPPPAPKKKSPPWLVAVVLLLVVGLCGGIGAAALSGGGSDPDPITDDDTIVAEIMCEDFIKPELKAPASAKFPKPQTVKSAATYTVTGAVDSQNSFGAMIRNNYTCKITNQGGEKWRLDDLILTEK